MLVFANVSSMNNDVLRIDVVLVSFAVPMLLSNVFAFLFGSNQCLFCRASPKVRQASTSVCGDNVASCFRRQLHLKFVQIDVADSMPGDRLQAKLCRQDLAKRLPGRPGNSSEFDDQLLLESLEAALSFLTVTKASDEEETS